MATKKIKKYQIALSAPDGISPQTSELYNKRKEAEEVCERYNKQNNNPYSEWVVIEKNYLIKV